MRADETVAVRATAPGPGGIAVVEVIGPRAREVVGRFVKVGRGLVRGRIVDEVLVRWAPRHGEPVVEVSCHGGDQPARAVIDALGMREVDRAFVLERAVASRRLDRTRAEALLLLPRALTLRAARMLQDQAAGALSRARSREALLETAPLGLALASPRRIVIAGAPNVGKSTLFNALVERDRALVSPVAGSTRDPVEETIAIDGIPFVLVDTAGASRGTELERMATERAEAQKRKADLVLTLGARREPWTARELTALRRRIVRDLGLAVKPPPGAPCVFTERQKAALGSPRWKRELLWGNTPPVSAIR